MAVDPVSRIPGIRRLFRVDLHEAGVERAVDDELRFHFDMTMKELLANGLNPDDARREAERRFGDVAKTREHLTSIDRARAGNERRAEWWNAFAQDLRYALRGLRLKPGFAAAVIATLGLGIGANATMFGIIDHLLFRPPAYLSAPDRDVRLYFGRTSRGKETLNTYSSYAGYVDVRDGTAATFDAMTPFGWNNLAVGSGDVTREMKIAFSGADLWNMFDAKPVIGRFFTAAEDVPPDGEKVAVLSFAFWQTQYGGRESALGSTLVVGAGTYTVIGVAPAGFNAFADESMAAFIPISAYASAEGLSNSPTNPWYSAYNMIWFEIFARRRPHVTPEAATAALTRVTQLSYKKQLAQHVESTAIEIAKPRAFAGPVLKDRGPEAGSDAKVAAWLVGVAAMVLLIACANVANLLLARALKRRREIAVRIALGVSRGRLLMQLITESMLLAVVGGAVGLAMAQWGGTLVRRTLLDQASDSPNAFTDARLLGFAALVAVVAGLLTGLVPALQTGRGDVSGALKSGSRDGTAHRSRLRAGLLVGQAALSVVLLVGAGLFLRSLVNVDHVRLGYDADRLIWVDLNLRGVKTDSVHEVQLRQQLLERAAHVPGVETAARALTVPFWSNWQRSLFVPGIDSVSTLGTFTLQAGSPTFFRTMGTRIVRGRGFLDEDREHAPTVMVVGASMASKLWPGKDAIGQCVKVGADTMPCTTVIGVAEDVRRGSMGETDMHYYMPAAQFLPRRGGLFVRTRGPAADQAESVRRALQQAMPGVSYVTVTPMSTIIASQIRPWRVGAVMFAVFGALALVIAAVGLYSVITYNVAQRTHEMGVRVALGAQARDVIQLVVREGLTIVLPGVLIGVVIALIAGRWMAPLLFDVSPNDPPVMGTVVATLTAVAIFASWVPARRAARIDPNEALRAD